MTLSSQTFRKDRNEVCKVKVVWESDWTGQSRFKEIRKEIENEQRKYPTVSELSVTVAGEEEGIQEAGSGLYILEALIVRGQRNRICQAPENRHKNRVLVLDVFTLVARFTNNTVETHQQSV
jgi:hypothetical protein